MDVSTKLKELRKKAGLTQQEVADKVDVSRVAVGQWESGSVTPRPNKIERLAELFGVYVPMMVLGSVHAGEFDEESVSDGDVVNVPSEVKERWPHARAVRARGTCMNKAIPDGHWFLVDPGTEPRNGDIAVVETEDYEAVVRRWYRGGDTLMLVADSTEHHEDIVIHWEDGAVRVIGTVVYEQGYLYR